MKQLKQVIHSLVPAAERDEEDLIFHIMLQSSHMINNKVINTCESL